MQFFLIVALGIRQIMNVIIPFYMGLLRVLEESKETVFDYFFVPYNLICKSYLLLRDYVYRRDLFCHSICCTDVIYFAIRP